MRLMKVLLVFVFALTACKQADHFLNENETNSPDNVVEEPSNQDSENASDGVDSEPIELSEEEILAQKLPATAKIEDWNLLLVNPWQALPEDFKLNLVTVNNDQQIDTRIMEDWDSWYNAALDAGHRLFFASGYRSVDRQRTNFNNTYEGYLNEGYSEDEAFGKTKEYLTEPGHSEHHTGLALDLIDEEWVNAGRRLEPDYDTQASQQWLVSTMSDYGFILRYPKGKEDITGIQYESWHFRYVGQDHARFMKEHNLVLEEYIELIRLRDEM